MEGRGIGPLAPRLQTPQTAPSAPLGVFVGVHQEAPYGTEKAGIIGPPLHKSKVRADNVLLRRALTNR